MKHHYKTYFFSRFLLSIVFFLLFLNNVFSQWTNINSPSKYQFQSIVFPSASIGFMGGVGGTYKSIDGGNTWNKIKYLPAKYSYSDSLYLEAINEQYLHFMSDSIGVIAGWSALDNSEVIIKTIDGGDTWTVKQKGAFDTELKSISFPSNSIGYVAGLKGRILKTTNAGDTWSALSIGTTNDLYGIYFIDVNNGYAVGDNVVLKTTNGGTSWSSISTSISGMSVYFTSPMNGYVGTSGSIFKTTNGGSTWTGTYLGQYQSVNKVLFTNDSTGYLATGVINDGKIFKTSSYGNYWEPMPSANDTLMLKDVFFKSQNEGFVVGDSGVIKHTINAGGHTKPVAKFISNATVYCQGDSAFFYNQTNPNCTFSWMLNDTIISSTYNLKIKLVNNITNTITLIANNSFATDTAKLVFKVGKKLTSIPINCKAMKDSICDNSGTTIHVFNSDTAAVYTFKNGATTIQSNVKGNGGALNFNTGVLNARDDPNNCCYYQVPTQNIFTIGVTKTTDCNTISSNVNYTITVFPFPNNAKESYTLTSVYNTYCQNDTAEIILKNSTLGWTYQLTESTDSRKAGALKGNGGKITFFADSLTRNESRMGYTDNYGGDYLSNTKQYYIVATNEAGCTSTLNQTFGNNPVKITVNEFKPNFDLKAWGIYPLDTLIFKNTIPGDITLFTWQLPGSSVIKSNDSIPPNVSYPSAANYNIKLVASSRSKNCIDSVEKVINVFNPLPSKLQGKYCWKNFLVDSTDSKTILAQHADEHGNVYVSGYKPSTYNSSEGPYFFLMKFDMYGNFIWEKKQNDSWVYIYGTSIVTDSLGNIYVGATFKTKFGSGTTFGNIGMDTLIIKSEATNPGYTPQRGMLLKFNKNGALLWYIYNTYDDIYNYSGISDILIDNEQNIYLSCVGSYHLEFTDGLKVDSIEGISIVKINSDGKYIKHTSTSNSTYFDPLSLTVFGRDIITDAPDNMGFAYFFFPKMKMTSKGNIILTGDNTDQGSNKFAIKKLFGVDNTKINYNNVNSFYNSFIALYDTSGFWTNAFSPYLHSTNLIFETHFFDIDKNDNIYLTGYWNRTLSSTPDTSSLSDRIVFETGVIKSEKLAFIAKYDINGNHLWHNSIESNSDYLSINGMVVSEVDHPFVATGIKYNQNYYKFNSVTQPPVGIKKDTATSNSVFIVEYDQNGNVLNNDVFLIKNNNYSISTRYGQFGILSKNKCGNIYYANTFNDIVIDSTHLSTSYNQIVIAKYAPDKQCAKHNCIPVTIPELFAYKYNDICVGEKIDLNWDAYNINKVNIIHSTNPGNTIDTIATNYNASSPPYKYDVINTAGGGSFIIQDASNKTVADTINFMLHPKPTITVSNDTAICNGHSITLNASTNGIGNTYQWQPGNLSSSIITVTPTGSATSTYTVNVKTQYGCKNSDSVKVTSQPLPSNSILLLNRADSDLLYPSVISPEFLYQWNYNNTIISGATLDTLFANKTGNYSLTVTNNQTGCAFTTPNKYILKTTDIATNNILDKNKILFTCDNDFITITFLSDKVERFDNLYLSDMTGKIVYEERNIILSPSEKKQISVNSLASSVYILTLYNGEKLIRSKISIIR